MNVQIFGFKKNADTRKALRFFAERRVDTHFVDLKIRPASPGELRRFVARFGAAELLDRNAPRFRSLGLHTAHLSEKRIVELLAEEPMLLRTPLVRHGNSLTVGLAESDWAFWMT